MIHKFGNVNKQTKFFPPTLIFNPSDKSQMMSEEIFGPILPIIEFNDIDSVINKINEGGKPLALYYYGPENGTNDKRFQ